MSRMDKNRRMIWNDSWMAKKKKHAEKRVCPCRLFSYKTLQETQSVIKTAEKLNEPVERVREIAIEYQVEVSD